MNPETTPPAIATPLAGGVPDRTPAASPAGVQPDLCMAMADLTDTDGDEIILCCDLAPGHDGDHWHGFFQLHWNQVTA